MTRLLLVIFLLAGVLLLPAFAADNSAQEQPEAKRMMLVALDFLELCDQGNYLAAWGKTGQLFQKNTSQEDWQMDISHLRRQHGELQQRQLLYTKQLEEPQEPGQPLHLLLFRSQFAIKSAAELLTLSKEQDQRWRVVGYSIE